MYGLLSGAGCQNDPLLGYRDQRSSVLADLVGPVQGYVRKNLVAAAGRPEEGQGIDGCGVAQADLLLQGGSPEAGYVRFP